VALKIRLRRAEALTIGVHTLTIEQIGKETVSVSIAGPHGQTIIFPPHKGKPNHNNTDLKAKNHEQQIN
jgi:hypothetical protein